MWKLKGQLNHEMASYKIDNTPLSVTSCGPSWRLVIHIPCNQRELYNYKEIFLSIYKLFQLSEGQTHAPCSSPACDKYRTDKRRKRMREREREREKEREKEREREKEKEKEKEKEREREREGERGRKKVLVNWLKSQQNVIFVIISLPWNVSFETENWNSGWVAGRRSMTGEELLFSCQVT